jgi:hypothetical protein
MRKFREDFAWMGLPLEQRDLLETWLFEENLGYAEILTRVKAQFGLEGSKSSLSRYYHIRVRGRQAEELVQAKAMADRLNHLPVDTNDLKKAALKLAGKAALKLTGDKPEDLETLTRLTRLLMENEGNELQWMRLMRAQQDFDFKAMAATQKDMPALRAFLMTVTEDPSLSEEEKQIKVQRMLFPLTQPPEKPPKPKLRPGEYRI